MSDHFAAGRSGFEWRLIKVLSFVLVALFLAPILMVLFISFTAGTTLQFPPPGLSLRWYQDVWAMLTGPDASIVRLRESLLVSPRCCLTAHRAPSRGFMRRANPSPPSLVEAADCRRVRLVCWHCPLVLVAPASIRHFSDRRGAVKNRTAVPDAHCLSPCAASIRCSSKQLGAWRRARSSRCLAAGRRRHRRARSLSSSSFNEFTLNYFYTLTSSLSTGCSRPTPHDPAVLRVVADRGDQRRGVLIVDRS